MEHVDITHLIQVNLVQFFIKFFILLTVKMYIDLLK